MRGWEFRGRLLLFFSMNMNSVRNTEKKSNAKRRLTAVDLDERGLVETNTDHMPREVALDCLRKPNLTNPERKRLLAATYRTFEPMWGPVLPEVKLTRKCKTATVSQLAKWLPRSIRRRAGLQRKYEALQALGRTAGEHETPRIMMQLRALSSAAAALDTFRDALETEAGNRHALVTA